MEKVFLRRGNYEDFFKDPQKILEGLQITGFIKELKKDMFVGLKIHFGEKDNHSYIKPDFLTPLVRTLKKIGARLFLIDTNTLYRGKRTNAIDHINIAYQHGFGKLNIPIIIGDGIKGDDYIEVKINGKHFNSCFLAHILKDIDFIIVLSHFTGHMLTGFGGAIKNLGMGFASRRGKMAQHCEVSPRIKEDRCINCGTCADICPVGAIGKREKFYIIEEKCIGCAQCISVCPQGAVKIIWSEEYELLGEKMVEYAYAAIQGKRCLYINFCLYITKECDCMNKETKGVVKDLGILYAQDPVSIDKASVDLINQQEGKDFIKELHPKVNYFHHLKYAEEIGLGSLNYKLVEI
jgi:hypothetical protein